MANRKKMLLILALGAAVVAIGVAIMRRRKKSSAAPQTATTPSGGATYSAPVDSAGRPKPGPGYFLEYGADGKSYWTNLYKGPVLS